MPNLKIIYIEFDDLLQDINPRCSCVRGIVVTLSFSTGFRKQLILNGYFLEVNQNDHFFIFVDTNEKKRETFLTNCSSDGHAPNYSSRE